GPWSGRVKHYPKGYRDYDKLASLSKGAFTKRRSALSRVALAEAMSFRELRNFTEITRALGYPRLVSVDNFRTPNFELVADVLYWMVKRYDPDITLSDSIETEEDRIEFLTQVARAMGMRAHIKLNPKKLYAADGQAVRELLKLANILYNASRAESTLIEDDDDTDRVPMASQLTSIKSARHLATEITEKGARLHDLMGKEKEARRARIKAVAFLEAISGNMSNTMELRYVEDAVKELLVDAKEKIELLQKQTEDLTADEQSLRGHIKKKRAELERNEKRLRSLQSHRPAFADELEKLEAELRRYYEVYVERFRNLDYLEHELDKYQRAEKAEAEESNRKRNRNAERIRREQLKQFIGRQPENEAAIEEELLRGSRAGRGEGSGAHSRRDRARGDAKVRGRMPDASEESGTSSDLSGSDLNDSDGTSTEEEVSLNDTSGASRSLIDDDDDESSA
ncbi:unnamed protein product, partial [Chrysoparadoxa australica]